MMNGERRKDELPMQRGGEEHRFPEHCIPNNP